MRKELCIINNGLILAVTYLLMLHVFAFDVVALEIVSPRERQLIEIGSMLRIVVKPQPGENIAEVVAGLDEIPFDKTQGAFVKDILIAQEMTPTEIAFEVKALTTNGQVITLGPRKIYLQLAAGVVLQAIDILDSQKTLFMYANIGEIMHIYVDGVYSDGVIRRINNPKTGTTFTSSDVEVVTVSATGDVKNIKNGTAVI